MKRAYKLTPVSMYDVHGLEKWLEKLAAQGLFLKKYRPLVCTFTRDEPRRVRYRLEPCHCGVVGPPDDMLDLYQEYGWQHVGGVNHEMVIFSCSDPHAPEPHTDPDIQLEQWNELYQKARREFHQMCVLTLVCLAICTAVLFWGGTPLSNLLIPQNSTMILIIFFFLRPLKELAVNFTRARELAAVIRELEGTPKKHLLWFPSRQFFSWLSTVIFAAALFLLLVLLVRPDLDQSRPIASSPLTISMLEQRPSYEDRNSYGRPCWSPLCWHQWAIWQFQSDSSLYIEWFDLPNWLSFLAVPSARDLMNDAMKLDDVVWSKKGPTAWVTREYPETGADWLSVADSEDGVYHIAAAAQGKKVVRVRYSGPSDLADHLDDIVAMIK